MKQDDKIPSSPKSVTHLCFHKWEAQSFTGQLRYLMDWEPAVRTESKMFTGRKGNREKANQFFTDKRNKGPERMRHFSFRILICGTSLALTK